MREMSAQRRKLAALVCSLAAMSGVGPALLRGHAWLECGWLAVYLALMFWVVVRIVRLRREEDASDKCHGGLLMDDTHDCDRPAAI